MLKVLELPIGIKVKVHSNGDIETLKHIKFREASRKTGICQWSIKRKGKEVM